MKRKLLSMLLILSMVFTMLPVSVKAEEGHGTPVIGGEIISFDELVEKEKTVKIGTAVDELGLPGTLTATVQTVSAVSGSSITVVSGCAINVSWTSVDYNADEEGTYTFTPVITDYTVKDGVEVPTITVIVEKATEAGYGIWVGGVELNSSNSDDFYGDGTVSYNHDDKTLALFGAAITGDKYGIYTEHDLTIVQYGFNTVYGIVETDTESAGIYAAKNLTIAGTGNLVVRSGVSDSVDGESSGIHIDHGNLTVQGGGILTASAGTADIGSYGICIHDGNIIIKDNSVVVALGGKAPTSAGIFLQSVDNNLTLKGSALSAHGDEAAMDSYGILSYGQILLDNDAILEATSEAAGSKSVGIYTNEILLNDGKLTAVGNVAKDMSYGIYCISRDSITINGGALLATIENAAAHSQAIDQVPRMASSLGYSIYAGTRATDKKSVGIDEFADNISDYKYVEVDSATKYNIWVGDVQVTSENKDDISCGHLESGTVSYNPRSNTLTLDNVMLTDAYIDSNGDKYGIYSEGDLIINRIGHSRVTVSSPENGKNSAGIHVCGNLTIVGDGTLVVTGSPAKGGSVESTGIHVDDGNLTIEDGYLIASGASVEGNYSGSNGICVHNGGIILKDEANVKAIGDVSDFGSSGVYVEGNITVEYGVLEAIGGMANGSSYGIGVYDGDMNVNVLGEVVASANEAISNSVGIYLERHLFMNGGYLEANGGSTAGNSYGIFCSGTFNEIKVYDGALTANGGSGASGSYGMLAGKVYNNGVLEATGGETGGDSYGISASEIVTEGGELIAAGGNSDGKSVGIALEGIGATLLQLNGGNIIATGGKSDTDDSYGVLAGEVIVNRGSLEAGGGNAKNRSFGLSFSDLAINGGKVLAFSGFAEGKSQAMQAAPSVNDNHRIYAGNNAVDAIALSADELMNSIDHYKYVEIEFYKEYDIWVGDVRVTTDNQNNITCDHLTEGIVTYDPYTNTLTLNGAMLTDAYVDAAGNKYGIYSEGDLNIERVGHNSVTVSSPEEGTEAAGIHVCGNLTILGDGSLVVTGGPALDESTGIHVDNGDLIIVGGSIIAFGAPSISGSYGICVHDGEMIIVDNATVKVSGDESELVSFGVYIDGNLIVESGDLEANAGSSKYDNFGIAVYQGNMTIKENGTVKASGNEAIRNSVGVYLERYLIIEDGKLEANGGSTGGESYGVFFSGHGNNLEFFDGTLIARGGSAASGSYGIFADNIYAYGGIIEAEGGPTGGNSYGLLIDGISKQYVVYETRITATGGDADEASHGIALGVGSYLELNMCKVTAVGGVAGDESFGILAENIEVRSSTLEAGGGDAGNRSFGLSFSELMIYSGDVIAYSGGASGKSQAMFIAPTFGQYYDHRTFAGNNAIDAIMISDDELISSIDNYKYIQINQYIEYDVWVGDVRVTSINKDNITCDHIIEGIVTYDPDSNTLILNDAMLTDAYEDADGNKYGIYSEGDLNIERIGHSSVTVSDPSEDKDAAGIHVCGNLTIFGDGKLVVTGSMTTGDMGESTGIHVDDGDLVIVGGELIAVGAPVEGSRAGSYGICVHNGNMILNGKANVRATGYESEYGSFGVYLDGDNISLSVQDGSSIKAEGKDADYFSCGIYFYGTSGQLEINSGKVTAIGGTTANESCGISVSKIILADNATLEATAGNGGNSSIGISSSEIVMSAGTLSANSGTANLSKPLNTMPSIGAGYSHINYAGPNAVNVNIVSDTDLIRNINIFRHVKIAAYASPSGNGGSGGGSYTPAPIPTPSPSTNAGETTIGNTEISASVDSNGTASIQLTVQNIKDTIAKAKAEAQKNGVSADDIKIVMNVSLGKEDADNFAVNLPVDVQKLLLDNEIAGLELVFENSDITIGIDNAAIKEINKQANSDVQITVTSVDNSKLSDDAKENIGDRPAYDFKTISNNGKNVTNFGSGQIYIRIPYSPANDEMVGYLYIAHVEENGDVHRIDNSVYDENSNCLIFTTNHFSIYGVAYTEPDTKLTDISKHWAKDSIEYVVARGLITGTITNSFFPDTAITREQLVSALGKLADIDAKAYTKNSFSDVRNDNPNRPYIEWAYSKGIINGKYDLFGPEVAITREEMALVLENFIKVMKIKLTEIVSEVNYVDASSVGKDYVNAVKSMHKVGIMLGKADNKFDPKAKVTRAELSAMLHRIVKLTLNPNTAFRWTQNEDGQYMYYKNGKVVTGWQTIDGVKYCFNEDGVLKTGFVKDDKGNISYYFGNKIIVGFWNIDENDSSKTYYFDIFGHMVSRRWYKIDGKWYYFNADGVLAKNTKISGYEVDENGVRKTK